jgi:CRP-like cAMP-binding protein
MAVGKNPIDKKILKSLEPIGGLSLDKLDELATKSMVEDMPAGRILFRQGERDKRVIYLLNGQVEVTATGKASGDLIKAKTEEARHPIAPSLPRLGTAKTKTNCKLLFIDRDLLEILMEENTSGLIEVEELSADDDSAWMLRFLQSRAFLKLPTENIQTLLMKLEEVPVKKGDIIIQQGDKNDYYYIIQSGRCAVSRRPAPKAKEVQIAILNAGDGFGEEALITGGRRNATISMLDNGMLMRLGKKDFMTDLAKPLINEIDEKAALDKINSGSLVIDVRKHDEFMQQRIEGSVNIPLTMLRFKVEGLNDQRDYILICDDGHRSSAASFLLTQHGLNCYVLEGGLNKNKLTLPAANLSVPVVKKAENRKTIAAKKTQKAAEAKAEKIQKEAATVKQEAKDLAKKASDAEAAKRKAEAEIKRLQEEEVLKREAALKAAKQRLQEESKRAKQAEEKAAKLKLEAKHAKRQAEEELRRLKAESDANARRQADLDGALNHAKAVAAESAKQAVQARKKAEAEAREIRRKAQAEAEQLRKEMEEARSRLEQETQQVQAKQAQQHRATLEAVREQAKSEAEQIRQAALYEAEQLRAEMASARQEVEEKAAQIATHEREQQQRLLDETRRQAEELARLKAVEAEKEAELIRRQAMEEAERLRNEIQSTRQLLESEVSQARAEAERIKQEKAHKQTKAEEQQRRAEARRKQQEEEAEQRRNAEAEKRRQQAVRIVKQKKADEMRRKAEAIKARLEQAEKARLEEEARNKAEGMSLSQATLRRAGNRIILEGAEDIFIFKEPTLKPEDVEEKEETVTELVEEVNELPSFKIETPEEEDYVPITKVELTETISRRFEEQSSVNKQRKRHTFTIAASILIAIGVGVSIFMLQPAEKKPALAARHAVDSQQKAAIAKPKLPVISESARHAQEQKLKQEAEKRHNSLLEEWKKKISALETKIGSTITETASDSQSVTPEPIDKQEPTNPQSGE